MERICSEFASVKLSHAKAIEVTLENSNIILNYGTDLPRATVQLDCLLAIIPAPKENGFVESDFLLLSVQEHQQDSVDAETGDRPVPAYSIKVDATQKLPADLASYCLPQLPRHLKVPQEHLHIVISTLSGACEAKQYFESVLKPIFGILGLSPQHYKVYETTSNRSIADMAATVWEPIANQGISQTIILLSGDGGVVDTINGLFRTQRSQVYVKPVVGLLALGTGNALANSSALNHGSTKGLSSLLRGTPYQVPLFQARFSRGAVFLTNEGRGEEALPKTAEGFGIQYGAVVASWGLHASLVADSDTVEYRKFGSDRFTMAAKELLSPSDGSLPHRYHGNITLFRKGQTGQVVPERWERRLHTYLVATLVSRLEKTLTISPESSPLDGHLRLVHFGVIPSDEVMRIFGMAFDGGRHVEDEAVGYEAIEGMHIEFDEPDWRWRRACVDGKIVKIEEGGWMEVRKISEGAIDLVTAL